MDFIATKIEKLLSKVSPIKRYFIRNVAREYYQKGYEDGQEFSSKVILRGTTLKEFVGLLNYYGIKFNYNLKRNTLIISMKPDKVKNLQDLINTYKEMKND